MSHKQRLMELAGIASLRPVGEISTMRTTSVKEEMGTDMNDESTDVQEAAVDWAWVPAAAAALGIAAVQLKEILKVMKAQNLKGFDGFMKAYKQVGAETSAAIDRSKGNN